jgi:hypothetical protein
MTQQASQAFDRVDPIGPSLADFEAGNFDPAAFDHRAHVYVGWCFLEQLSLAEAIQRFTRALRRFTESIGQHGKYHETISWFFLIQIANRRQGTAATCWQSFCNENSDLLNCGGALLRQYYSESLLESPRAKDHFLLPDRAGS